MLALCGAHGAGKSTLAEAWARRRKLAFVASRTAQVFEALGLPVGRLSPHDRRRAQDATLDAWEADVAAARGPWVSDRSPLDMAAYALLDIAGTGEEQAWIEDYVARCVESTERHATAVVLVRPGIPYVPRAGRPAPCWALQHAHDLVLCGLLRDQDLGCPRYAIPRDVLDLGERMKVLDKVALVVQGLAMREAAELGGREAFH